MRRSKRILALLLSIVMMLGMVPFSALAAEGTFSDVKTSDWFYDDVQYVCEKGLMNGTGSGTFSPKATTTRGMIVTILYRLSGTPAVSGACPFSDVAAGSYYEAPITWAAANAIVSGYTDGTFAPDGTITREQLAAILYRYAKYCGYDVTAAAALDAFADAGAVSEYARAAMQWAAAEGLVTGSGSRLDPQGSATRAQVAAILARFCRRFTEKTGETKKPAASTGTGWLPTPEPTPDPKPDPDETYTVTFDSNGGSAVECQTVAAGQPATEPEEPTKEGYRFVAWYNSSALTELYDFATPVTANITLYAKWEVITSGEGGFLDEPEAEVEIYSFDVDKRSILVGETQVVTFTAEVFSEIELTSADVALYEGSDYLGSLNDDGLLGDEAANDGIYTLQIELSQPEECCLEYYVSVKEVESQHLEIGYYVEITAEELEAIAAVDDEISALIEDADFIAATDETKLEKVVQLLTKLVETGKVADGTIIADKNSMFVAFQYACGVYGGVSLMPISDELNGGHDVNIEKPNTDEADDTSIVNTFSVEAHNGNAVCNAIVIDGFEQYKKSRRDNYNKLNTEWNAMGINTTIYAPATVERMKNLAVRQANLIVFSMHGSKYTLTGGIKRPVLCMNETVTSQTDKDYSYELKNRMSVARVLCTDGFNHYWVMPGFFTDNYTASSFTNKMIFSESCMFYGCDCQSKTPDNTLAQILINCGAGVVIGYHNSVDADYSINVMRAVVEGSFNGLTASAALNAAREEYGKNDKWSDLSQDKYIAYPKLMGRYDYVLRSESKLAGVIKSAADRSAVANALIRVYTPDGEYVTSARTDADGKYTIGVAAGEYVLKVSASSYKSVKMAVSVQEGHTAYTETFLLLYVGISTGFANGTITNSITGVAVDGVTVNVRLNWNNREGEILYTTQTNNAGYYDISYTMGLYTIEYYKSGYITGYKNIIVSPIDFEAQDAVISPVTSDSAYRIVLTWGENPRDLDSHMVGTLSSGESFHVYYGYKSQMDGDTEVCNLDIDDTTSYGPETITLNATTKQPYYYYVYRYAGSGTVAASEAQVKVYRGSELVQTFYVPTDLGNGDYWNVFAIVDGELRVRNTITDDAEISYAGALTDTASLNLDVLTVKKPILIETENSEETD